ncbi:uncharacterized protein K02A2.6-like [Tachysurus ichikawai]
MDATAVLPHFPRFDIDSDQGSLAVKWKKWLSRFGTFLTAAGVTNKTRQRAMLLHYAGEQVQDIFDTIPENGDSDDYDKAAQVLTEYFSPSRNTEYEVYVFRQAKQKPGETIDAFHTRLRQLATTCEFTNIDREIKSQIILTCTSSLLRRRALRDSNLTLKQLLDFARAFETSEQQAAGIENDTQANTFESVAAIPEQTLITDHGWSGTTKDTQSHDKDRTSRKSHKTATELGLLHVVLSTDIIQPTHSVADQLLSKYPNITNGIRKLKNVQVKLHIDDTVKPVAPPHRRIPFHVRKKFEKELQLLEDEGIIEKVEGPTHWVSPIVAMPRPKNPEKIRICVDMRLPNQAVFRVRHISPTVDDIIHDLNGAVMFSKLDLNSGYHQLELAPESRYIATFSTHVGLQRYTRLIFGISSAAEVFQNTIQQVLQSIPGVRNFSDDILVYGNTADAHNRSLEAVFQRLHENNLTINKGKCDFHKTSLEFFGYLFSNKGIAPDPTKNDMPPPLNQSEMRSLLGMANYSVRFIPN